MDADPLISGARPRAKDRAVRRSSGVSRWRSFQGETLVLLGKSGGGKSVFLRHLIGLMKPVSGQKSSLKGRDIAGLNERELVPIRRKIGMLFQDGALFDSMNCLRQRCLPVARARGER